MGKIKKQKVLRFKNIPSKKEASVTKKKDTISRVSTKKIDLKEKKQVVIPKKVVDARFIASKPVVEKEKVWDANTAIENTTVDASRKTLRNGLQNRSGGETLLTGEQTRFGASGGATQKPYFPKISRFITDRWFLLGLITGILLIGILIAIDSIHRNSDIKNLLLGKRESLQLQAVSLQQKAQKYPGSRDLYFQLALLEYQLGNFNLAQNYVNKVELLDPNFEKAYALEKILQKK